MSTAAWVCDSCESNNLAGATVCRVCQRKPGSATGTVRAVPAPVALPPQQNTLQPTFGVSRHAAPPKITLAPVPTPHVPPPVRKPPPPVPKPVPPRRSGPGYPRPPVRPRPVRRVSGRQIWRTIKFVAVGLLLLGVATNLGSWLDDLNTPATAPPSTSPSCPAAVSSWLPGGSEATLVAAYTTERHVITLCRDGSGQLYYDGQLRNSAATPDTHISIPAEQTSSGFVARNKNYVYEITATEVVVTIDGKERSRAPLTRTAP
jgi:hypothetical protein